MIQIQTNEKGVLDVRIIALTKEEEQMDFLMWPAIRIFVQMMNDVLETEFKEGVKSE